MSWEQSTLYDFVKFADSMPSIGAFRVNEECFIRKEHGCGKVQGASKSCFIACPTDDELEPILELMSEKLTKVGIEPIVAVKERAYGQDIFCTKICGKIIEARFCIVILDDTITNKYKIPNPNVYYEYGLMTSLGKHIIPLQKEGLELAFNIQSYDTIKYNSKNIGRELDRAIKDAIKITDSKAVEVVEKDGITITEKAILRRMEMADFEAKDSQWFLNDVIDDTKFKGFSHKERGFYLYLGKIDREEDQRDYLEDLSAILYRTERKARELAENVARITEQTKLLQEDEGPLREKIEKQRLESRSLVSMDDRRLLEKIGSGIDRAEKAIEAAERKLASMHKIYIGFIVNPTIQIEAFIQTANSAIETYDRYELVYSQENTIAFGETTVSLMGFDFGGIQP